MKRFREVAGFTAMALFAAYVFFQTGRAVERAKWKAEVEALAEQVLIIEEEVDRLSSKYEVLYAVIQCESSGRHDVWGDGGRSYGLLQFQKRSFDWMSEKAGFDGDWKNQEDQIKLFLWAVDSGLGDHWTCYRKHVASGEGGLS